MKKKPSGRKTLLSGNISWEENVARAIHHTAHWRIVRLLELLEEVKAAQAKAIGDSKLSKLADNYLSSRKAQWQAIAAEKRYVELEQIDSFWRDLSAEFERAVVCGRAAYTAWLKAQLYVLTHYASEGNKFKARVIKLLEHAMWSTHAREGEHREDLTLTPAGKFADAMARHIYEALDKTDLNGRKLGARKLRSGEGLKVEDRLFQSKEDAMDAIRDIATVLGFTLSKQRRKRPNG